MNLRLASSGAALAVVAAATITSTCAASAHPVPSKAQWLADVTTALRGGTAYVDSHRTNGKKPAIVLDIDNTALESYYEPYVATPPVLAFERRAVSDGYTVLVATGRSADTGGTLKQLTTAGYKVAALCFKNPSAASIQASKTACRDAWVAQGYTIVANVGNHTTDLEGGNSGKQYLLPNYGFLQ